MCRKQMLLGFSLISGGAGLLLGLLSSCSFALLISDRARLGRLRIIFGSFPTFGAEIRRSTGQNVHHSARINESLRRMLDALQRRMEQGCFGFCGHDADQRCDGIMSEYQVEGVRQKASLRSA